MKRTVQGDSSPIVILVVHFQQLIQRCGSSLWELVFLSSFFYLQGTHCRIHGTRAVFFFRKKTREIKWDLELTQRYCEAQMDLAYVWCFGDKPNKCLRHFTWPVWQNPFGHGGGGFCSESTTVSSTTWQCLAEELSFQNSAGVEIGRWLMHRPGVASARLDWINGPLDDTQEVHWCTCQFK